jgi:RND family efflux transporter MFP subunit
MSGTESTANMSRAEHKGHEKKPVRYHCPMHPNYISERPGDCPICGMKLVPVEETEIETPKAQAVVEGYTTVKITPEKQQLIGVTFGAVERKDVIRIIRTVGRVTYDETRLVDVNTKFSGWIEELYVDYTGKEVKKGEPLMAIYSPDLVSTQEEYLLALRTRESVKASKYEEVRSGGDALVEAAKRRLLYWDITEEQIKELENSGKSSKTMVLNSPIYGYVIEKMAFKGKYVMAGENLYRIADLSTVWVYADIYEYEVSYVEIGQEADVNLSYYPGKTFVGKVSYIYPYVEPMTRTVKVRMEFQNSTGELKPGMYAQVMLNIEYGEQLIVPKAAIMDSGTRQIAFVDKGGGFLEPREVKLGARGEDEIIVLSGLDEGERVVTSGNFLIDSESKLKAAIGGMGSMEAGHKHGGQ